MYSSFKHSTLPHPIVLRERTIREGKIEDLASVRISFFYAEFLRDIFNHPSFFHQMGIPPDILADKDGSLICDKLPICKEYIEELTVNVKEA
jgi:hypothetical protein